MLYTSNIKEGTVKQTVALLLSTVTAVTTHSRHRLKALLCLLNIVLEEDIKYDVLINLIAFALATKSSRLIAHFHTRVDEWVVSWKLDLPQKRKLYQSVSELLAADNKVSLSLTYLIKFFDTFAGEKYPPEVEEIAVTAVLSAIKSPVSSFTDRSALLEVNFYPFEIVIQSA